MTVKNNNTFGRNILYMNEDLVETPQTPGITDRLRHLLKKYYTINENGMITYANNFNQSSLAQAQIVERNNEPGNTFLQFKFLAEPESNAQVNIFMNALGALINTSAVYSDFSFRRQAPIPAKTLEKVNRIERPVYINSKGVYNFFEDRYEKFMVNNPTVSENVLPNFYTIYAQATGQQDVGALNSLYNNFTTNPSDDAYEIESQFLTTFAGTTAAVRDSFANYFGEFAQDANNMMKTALGQTQMSNLSSAYNTYIFDNNAIPMLTSDAIKGEMFPLYNEIKFSTDTNSLFSDILARLQLEREIVYEVIANPNPLQYNFGVSSESYMPSSIMNMPPNIKYEFSPTQSKSWDIKEWIQNRIFNNNAPGTIVLGDVEEDGSMTPASTAIDQQGILMGLGASINQFAANTVRTLRQVMDGKSSYAETLFYKIQKFSTQDLQNPITTYYVPNSSELGECRFIDTQVRYNKNYTYTITSYVLVVGTQYSYNTFNPIDSTTVNIGVGAMPTIKLFEVPLTTSTDLLILDNPPMAPESSIVSYKNISNRVLINMNGSTGDRVMTPVVIEPTDKETFDELRFSQQREDGKLRFKSDDAPASFQVFRTTTRPLSYEDFGGARVKMISTNGTATSAAIEDDISPDVKYYYTLRAVDVHGHVSNPSPVYELEMKSTAGPPYMVINVVDFQEEVKKNKVPLKSMRRYVQIIPTTTQGLLNVEESGLIDATSAEDSNSIYLGVADEKLWGKSFRFRFTSKKTGRKIDLDVNFRAEHQLKQS